MASPTFRLLACCVLLSSAAWAQQPSTAPSRSFAVAPPGRYVPAPPSAAAREALRLHQEGCQAEGFDDAACEKAVRQLEAVVRDDPRQLDAQLALADAVWNQAFRQPEGSAERARLRQRSLDLYQQLVNLGIQDARPYYGLSVLTRDPEARIRLLRRTLELNPKHPEAHKDLAGLLLDQGQTDEAVREYRTHLSVRPYEGREDALADIQFADRLAAAGRVREAAQVYDAVWDATAKEPRAERCQIFKSVDLDPYERMGARFAQRLREIRTACSGTPRLEGAVELERQGKDDAAIQELERQIQENPAPAEPYLALQRLHLKQGRAEEAAGVMARYFQQEKDPQERCRHFRTLSPRTTRAMEPALISELDRTCRARKP
ncbi:tetratricopeptide repeat protein [Archangium lansingense]|uniref:Tetratricopeptide repeat protein n=1 Tax=Archangium lansingense TaxID=2995310 RepID=A0ABT4AKN5_9BACT|nr:tetratricopeptide repeat protein [Archangium lansinium]MCY1082261.1 tetratricopeptide repeat protein [Archangium lansinium]